MLDLEVDPFFRVTVLAILVGADLSKVDDFSW